MRNQRYLSDEVDQILKVSGQLLWLQLEDGPGGLKVTKLLQELFLVRERITLDEVLKLRNIGRQQSRPVALSH